MRGRDQNSAGSEPPAAPAESLRRRRHRWLDRVAEHPAFPTTIYTTRRVWADLIDWYRGVYYPGGKYRPDAGEKMGVLIGSVAEAEPDSERWVVVIQGFAECPTQDAGGTHAEILARDRARAIETAQARYPGGEELVGWYHTHPNMPLFLSPPDQETYNTCFPELWQAAMVFDPGRWVAAYFPRNAELGIDGLAGSWRELSMVEESVAPAAPTEAKAGAEAGRRAARASSRALARPPSGRGLLASLRSTWRASRWPKICALLLFAGIASPAALRWYDRAVKPEAVLRMTVRAPKDYREELFLHEFQICFSGEQELCKNPDSASVCKQDVCELVFTHP